MKIVVNERVIEALAIYGEAFACDSNGKTKIVHKSVNGNIVVKMPVFVTSAETWESLQKQSVESGCFICMFLVCCSGIFVVPSTCTFAPRKDSPENDRLLKLVQRSGDDVALRLLFGDYPDNPLESARSAALRFAERTKEGSVTYVINPFGQVILTVNRNFSLPSREAVKKYKEKAAKKFKERVQLARKLAEQRKEERRLRKIDRDNMVLANVTVSPSSRFFQIVQNNKVKRGNKSDSQKKVVAEQTKSVGYMAREEGRFGSLPLHDEYGDEANSETTEWQDSYEMPYNTGD